MTALHAREMKIEKYERPEIEKGYANQILKVDLTQNDIAIKPVSEEVKKTFIGGKGFDLWLLWHAVTADTQWNDSENAVCIASGPMGGTPSYPGSGKSIVTTISPTTGSVIDSNVGGHFGPFLKFSGFDALAVTGRSDGNTVIVIDGNAQQIKILEIPGLPDDAYALTARLTEHFSGNNKEGISIVSTGTGAKHTLFGCLNFSWYDPKRKRSRSPCFRSPASTRY